MRASFVRYSLALLLCFASTQCVQPLSSSRSKATAADFKIQPEILSENNFWNYLAGSGRDPNYSGYIKFSLTVDESGRFTGLIWHPESFAFHALHLTTLPEFAGLTPQQIDSISLSNKGRRVLLGTLLLPRSNADIRNPETIDIQLMGSDPLAPEFVAEAFSLVKKNFFSQPEVYYYPVAEQISFANSMKPQFEALGVRLAERKASKSRVCYNQGWGVGRVRIVKQGELEGLLAEGSITSEDILVMDEVPRELPVVAGIVVSQSSSPSSHPALLAGMLGIPFIYEESATSLPSWIELARNQAPVFFQATGEVTGSCSIVLRSGKSLTVQEAASLTRLKRPLPLQVGDFDRNSKTPIALDMLGRGDAQRVGAKAANVAELRRIIPDHTIAEGLALPVGLFAEGMELAKTASGESLKVQVDAELKKLFSGSASSKDIAEGLTRVRLLIEGAKLAATTRSKILTAIEATFPLGTKIKLRSSSNIEDSPEFNGAGLYESKGACVGDDGNSIDKGLCGPKKDPVIKSMLKVWSSLYSLKAWVARRYYGVTENYSGMGVLVQRSFKGELANGVAISGFNQYYGNPEQKIDVQSTGFPGEDLEVANPPAGKVPETAQITSFDTRILIPSTEIPRGRTLLSEAMSRQLYDLITIIHSHYQTELNPVDLSQFKLDMEWKLVESQGQQKIIIKQVRPVPAQASSTQGLDRGTMIIGERNVRLCPKPTENSNGFSKLALSRAFDFSVALHEIPLAGGQIPNPIEILQVAGVEVKKSEQSRVEFGDWLKYWGTQDEYREFTLSSDILLDGRPYKLQWGGRQRRPLAQPRLLVNHTQTAWGTDFRIEGSGFEDHLNFHILSGSQTCESDAFQGYMPGTEMFELSAFKRSEPYKYATAYSSFEGSRFKIAIEGRTSFQGIDKTRFIQVDKAQLSGLTARSLTISAPLRSVYAPSHHNFQFEYAFDVLSAEDLTEQEREEIQAKGLSKLVIRQLDPYDSSLPFIVDPSSGEELRPNAALIGLDPSGQETRLDYLRVEFVKNEQPDMGFGIGPS